MRFMLVAFCATLLVARSAEAQRATGAVGPVLAGYRVGMTQVSRRALPCEKSEGFALCQPSSDVWLRFRDSVLIDCSPSMIATGCLLATFSHDDAIGTAEGAPGQRCGQLCRIVTSQQRKCDIASSLSGVASLLRMKG